MISLTRLNGQRFVLNAEHIRLVEENPDTVITLVGGEHLVARESVREVVARVIEFQRHTRRLSTPDELREELRGQIPSSREGSENIETRETRRQA
ncbi:MAG: flagellar FlbD family protein [Phycisphaerales bacterium]